MSIRHSATREAANGSHTGKADEILFPQVPLPEQLTYEFLGTFARCEYALKCSGFKG
ncbi:hypothetical protein BN2476_680030 [Paraburkholderia piptadeniae]|uniref:Uncharacterized protein n=1 Tax=Paraburkholderia piptadeniae TaxID=1701573 RepID=A0A1N7SPA7_9BURK|nr:hypothetical protein BN2476_680030 [Paraburkholderia piptadeniae]